MAVCVSVSKSSAGGGGGGKQHELSAWLVKLGTRRKVGSGLTAQSSVPRLLSSAEKGFRDQ